MSEDHCLLAIFSNPEDSDRLRLDRERRSLSKVLESVGFTATRLTVLDAASVDDALNAMAKRPYSIIHFSGHGEHDGIFVEGEDPDRGEVADAARLEQVLQAGQPHLKLAVFLSCFSASFADQLISHVPHIVAVTGPASDEACIRFVDCFYARLLAGDDVDRAYTIASRRVVDLDVILLRRALRDGSSKALVRYSIFNSQSILYIDTSGLLGDISRFGIDEDSLLSLMSRKIYFHQWAFRYPRSKAIFSIGDLFGSFSWDNAEDAISCDRLFRLKKDAPEPLSEAFAMLLIEYSDRYVASYRSPMAVHQPNYQETLGTGLMKLEESFNFFFGSSFDQSGKRENEDRRGRLSVWPDLLREHMPGVFKASKSVGHANLASAERKFRAKDFGGCVAHLEAALSSLHDLMNELGGQILE